MTASMSRRGFLVGCSSAIAAMAGARLNYVAFGSPEAEPTQEILVTIFLRGGCDGLNVVAPLEGGDRGLYESARAALKLPANSLLSLGSMGGATGTFGLHPAAAPLHELYQAGKLAIVHAAGLTHDTRSHFDAMDFMERGTPQGGTGQGNGWLTRHLQSGGAPGLVIPSLAVGNLQPSSLLGSEDTIAMNNPADFSFYGHWRYGPRQRAAMERMYTGADWLRDAGGQTLDAVSVVEQHYGGGTYTPANGAQYPNSEFGRQLAVLAQVIKWQLGLQVATVDLGGWDTHEYQGNTTGYFTDLLAQLAGGLKALYTDLDGTGSENYTQRLTVVVMSEFGRRLKENASGGTDHGHGNIMFVLGGNVLGGLKGTWPGLAEEQLYERTDLAITTDYRRVLSEILIRRMGNANLANVFPSYTGYTPLGVVSGPDLPPVVPPTSHQVFLPIVTR